MYSWKSRSAVLLAWGYLGSLGSWFIFYSIFGDRWWWLFLVNSLAFYLFIPLLLVPLVATLTRHHTLWLGVGIGMIIWGSLYGSLFMPITPVQANAPAPHLSLMSYNMLRHNTNPEPVLAAIRASDADVIAMQELNSAAAEAIARELREAYPYQLLEPRQGKSGMGIISRYPLSTTGDTFPGDAWIGPPQIVDLAFGETTVRLINLHAVSTSVGYGGNIRFTPGQMEWSIRERERQMQLLANYADSHSGPLLVAGDFNTTDRSNAYALVNGVLTDAWRAAGQGLGHTFPGATTPGGSRPRVSGIPLPMWLVRIDHIFYSQHWQATDADFGPWDNVSDHRPLMVQLRFTEE